MIITIIQIKFNYNYNIKKNITEHIFHLRFIEKLN